MSGDGSNPAALLRQVARLYTRAQRDTAKGCNFGNTQCHVLTELDRAQEITSKELARRLGFEKSWISRSLDALTSAGLVAKGINPADGRSSILSLTPSGKRRARRLQQALDDHAAELFTHLTAAERARVADALQLLRDALVKDASRSE